jgi:hypothetical protein
MLVPLLVETLGYRDLACFLSLNFLSFDLPARFRFFILRNCFFERMSHLIDNFLVILDLVLEFESIRRSEFDVFNLLEYLVEVDLKVLDLVFVYYTYFTFFLCIY